MHYHAHFIQYRYFQHRFMTINNEIVVIVFSADCLVVCYCKESMSQYAKNRYNNMHGYGFNIIVGKEGIYLLKYTTR